MAQDGSPSSNRLTQKWGSFPMCRCNPKEISIGPWKCCPPKHLQIKFIMRRSKGVYRFSWAAESARSAWRARTRFRHLPCWDRSLRGGDMRSIQIGVICTGRAATAQESFCTAKKRVRQHCPRQAQVGKWLQAIEQRTTSSPVRKLPPSFQHPGHSQ